MKWAKETVDYWCKDIRERNFQGQGVGIAVLDTGIILHPDFGKRIIGFSDFVNKRNKIYDESGHGTHVAGILAGSGRMSDGVYAGMAPLAELLIAKVLDGEGNGTVEYVIEGIQWVLALHKRKNIRIVNGTEDYSSKPRSGGSSCRSRCV